MGHKVDISEVAEFSDELTKASEEVKSSLTSVEEGIESISTMSSFSGKTANEAKAYLEDLHKTILTSFYGLFTDLDDHLKKHLQSFQSRVDSSESAIIDSDYLNETEQDISGDYDRLSEEQEAVRKTLSSVSDISSASHPISFTFDGDKDDVIETITDLEEKLDSFKNEGKQQISETEELLHHIEVTLKNAGSVKGDARFTDYKGDSTAVGLPVLQGYNADKREAMLERARETKDGVIKDLNEPLQKVLNKAYTNLRNGEIDETQYYSYLAELKGMQSGESPDEEVSEGFVNYMVDNHEGIKQTLMENIAPAHIGKKGNDVLRRADLVKAMNANKPSPTSNFLSKQGKNIIRAGRAVNGSLVGVSFGVGLYDDLENKDKTWGEAISHNSTSTGLGLGTSMGASFAIKGIAGAFGLTAGGWAVVGGVVVGTGVTWGFNWVYDNNILGIQDGLDWAGQKIDEGWDWTTGKVSDGWNWAGEQLDNAGEALSSGLDAIIPIG